jgi:hypothetical protein
MAIAAAQAWQQCSQAAGYRVEIVQRDVNWAAARDHWDVGTGLKNQASLMR